MDAIVQFIISHSIYTPLIISFCILLAGLNIPVSIDILLALCAYLTATVIPQMTYPLYFVFLISCIFSAWIAYSVGRGLNNKIFSIPLIRNFISRKKLEKMGAFYTKYGPYTYLITRFIPFGVRNAVFISSGMTKVKFSRFALFDAIGCIAWSSIFYTFFYQLSVNLDQMIAVLRHINLAIFIGFSVTLIGVVCYKYTKQKKIITDDNRF